ncbi:HK97 family phage prohead protease [Poseidonocella sp. HB161398]|uniref:HK97 family phage prohead protease n=1 Tax=Poseidonocella sp. HB161398 TaxID=2320855 RepID=UPI001108C541|nr:HK97 family phage prohead protease [Poseidonocella sp. HB161398]
MLWGGHNGGLELRKRASGAMALAGRFPYGKAAVLTDGGRTGRPRKEIIAPKAFGYRINTPSDHGGPKDIHLLVGHSYDRPLASVRSGTLKLTDTAEAVTFEAVISPEMQQVSWVQDILAALAAGLIIGISPGFRLPPKRAVEEAEKIEQEANDPENGMHQAIIRTVMAALLYELSLVTRPAYPETQVEERNWRMPSRPRIRSLHSVERWR